MGDVYCKAFASIEDFEEKDYGPNGGFTAILSTPSVDRDDDELFREEWKDFSFERYPLDMDHGMSVAETVGSFKPYFDGQKMMMDAYFSSIARAQEVRTLVDEGHIRTVSVAFMVDKTKKSGEPKRELLNAGIVAIPSNRDAVILASKAASALKDALSDTTEGEVPEDVKQAVLEILTDQKEVNNPLPQLTMVNQFHGQYQVLDFASAEDAKAFLTKQAELVEGTEDTEKPKGIYVDIIPRLDATALKGVFTELLTKASATASGMGGDGALIQAIHDASSHLGAGCPVIEVTDEGSGADDGGNKSITFTHKTGQSMDFDSHDEAREFFDDMLESIKSAEERDETLVSVAQDADAFEKALNQVLTPDESPAEAAAASDEEPAPADDAADFKARKRARELDLCQLRAQSRITN